MPMKNNWNKSPSLFDFVKKNLSIEHFMYIEKKPFGMIEHERVYLRAHPYLESPRLLARAFVCL